MIAKSCFFLLFLHVANSEICQTPHGQQGDCVPIEECPSLYFYLEQSTISHRSATFLKKSHCGFSGKQPKVCCPSTSRTSRSKSTTVSSNLLPSVEECGLHTNDKIVGGEKAELDEFPWMALLQFQLSDGTKSFECGGSLINNRYVLTAAHCILPSLIGVRLGEYNTETNPDCLMNAFGNDCADPAVDFGIEETIVHEDFGLKSTGLHHDIALIRLDREVKYSDFIKPICLPLTSDEVDKSYLGKHLIVSGWGLTEKMIKSSIKLRARIPVQDLAECTKKYQSKKPSLVLDDGQICAGGVMGRDSCKADSGGPLMTFKRDKKREPHLYAIGVVSFGPNPCGQEKFPAVYTKVARYATWIVSKLKP